MIVSEKEKKVSAWALKKGDEYLKGQKDGFDVWTKDLNEAMLFAEPWELKSKGEELVYVTVKLGG